MFASEWDFFNASDPTKCADHAIVRVFMLKQHSGNVVYVTRETAQDEGLAFVVDGEATMKVDNWSWLAPGQNRNRCVSANIAHRVLIQGSSVRIESKKIYNGGLFILDVKASPFGCSAPTTPRSSGVQF